MIGHDPCLRQGLLHRCAVGRARVHRDDLHLVLPGLTASIQPLDHFALLAPRCLIQQALPAAQVDEVGLEPLELHPPPVC